jgi:hypothetical protein
MFQDFHSIFPKGLSPTKAIRPCAYHFSQQKRATMSWDARFMFLTRGASANFFQQMAMANANQGDAGSSASIATGGAGGGG